ncbi:MAG: tetratricopeptide repeat protein [Planctomycetaceae bacterium]|nr:tetratricopeptide repeat protein [Planctomycetaceae bacterium]
METTSPPSRRARTALLLGLAAAAVAPFLPALAAGFTNWDDNHNFLDNPNYRGLGWSNLKWMFTYGLEHYIPLTWITLGADYVLWGMDARGYHLTSLLFHALNAVLFFHVAEELLRRARPELSGRALACAAAVAALLFAVHPLRAESVAWITERRDVVSGVFFLLTILVYLRAADAAPGSPERRRRLALSAGCFALMMLSKAMGMTLPLALLVLDVWPLRRYPRESARSLVVEKLPHVAVMAGAVVLTWFTQTSVDSIDREAYPPLQSLVQPGLRVPFYVLKTLVPVGLAPLYHYRPAVGAAELGGWAVLIATSGAAIALRRRAPAFAAAWLSYLILIAPVSGLLQTGIYYAADRYSYLACLPFALLGAGLFAALQDRKGAFAVAPAALLLAVLAALSWRQAGYWQDSERLWSRQISIDPESWPGWLNRGSARQSSGNLAGALEDYGRCLALKPENGVAWTSRGSVKLDLGDSKGAVEDFDRAIALRPESERAWNLRGLARERLGDREGARGDYDHALELRPSYAIAYANRGFLRRQQGDLEGALRDAEEALRNDPKGATAYVLRASVRRAQGRVAEALDDLNRAVELAPTLMEALNNRALLFMQARRYGEALADYDRGVAVSPRDPVVRMGRGQARLMLGDAAGAAADLRESLKLAPPAWPYRKDVETLLQSSLQRR